MKLIILCPRWGQEHLEHEDFFIKVKDAGYDGVDTWLPEDKVERNKFIRLLNDYDLSIVSHQHQAIGNNISEFCKSFEYYLHLSSECNPILINSHSGRDSLPLHEQLQVIDTAQNFSNKTNIRVAHETHRGRIGFSPVNSRDIFNLKPEMKITADFSHWVCVTESYLEHFQNELAEAIVRSEHIHARVGFKEGPQVPDPRHAQWREPFNLFLNIWDRIIEWQSKQGNECFTITPEFGPPPYMWVHSKTGKPVANQWDINVFMKNIIRKRYSHHVS